ncbi:MAG: SIS domain-containing protein [Clostridia bacterium]|nr:SIS domain-containing protein [Clostridia bacterium]
MKNREIFDTLVARYPALESVCPDLEKLADRLCEVYVNGGKLLVAGNGGSAADAEHIVGELMKGFCRRRPLSEGAQSALIATDPERGAHLAKVLQQGLPAIALTGHAALSTAFANDCDPNAIFAQQVWGYGNTGDLLIVISTSGNAENLMLAATAAHAKGMTVALLTGEHGGKLSEVADIILRAPAKETYQVQEYHLPLYHALCLLVEDAFFAV